MVLNWCGDVDACIGWGCKNKKIQVFVLWLQSAI